ncbi:hypothetical protein Micbo1qcDRAFT_180486 [Microdochium bolleyi]|uniref:Uncharacterized protein n=1 Tax=Microdochium bolleyi TaxID=196109 RepID=A0A136IM13_9PEZI|nr:hypothetical protein Micbo1qcDRAFT_180486 [Microdochium bolleyi]
MVRHGTEAECLCLPVSPTDVACNPSPRAMRKVVRAAGFESVKSYREQWLMELSVLSTTDLKPDIPDTDEVQASLELAAWHFESCHSARILVSRAEQSHMVESGCVSLDKIQIEIEARWARTAAHAHQCPEDVSACRGRHGLSREEARPEQGLSGERSGVRLGGERALEQAERASAKHPAKHQYPVGFSPPDQQTTIPPTRLASPTQVLLDGAHASPCSSSAEHFTKARRPGIDLCSPGHARCRHLGLGPISTPPLPPPPQDCARQQQHHPQYMYRDGQTSPVWASRPVGCRAR